MLSPSCTLTAWSLRWELITVVEKLLADRTTRVIGSADIAFGEVCHDMNELMHKNGWKPMSLLVDVEEWGQIVIGSMTQFTDPNLRQMILQMKMRESSMRTAMMMMKRKMMRKQQSSCINWIPIAAYCCAVPRPQPRCTGI
jgi:hypothetical protein